MGTYGLIGKNIDYSFSKSFFKKKFEKENLIHNYVNFDIKVIDELPLIFSKTKDLLGLNVTVPYKETIIPYLDKLNSDANKIGAVNTIKIKNGKLIGYNTDHYGFSKSIIPKINKKHRSALIIGTGGAAKAIYFALNKLNIKAKFISREPKNIQYLSYSDLTPKIIKENLIIINCTPVGTYPNIDKHPLIPYEFLNNKHLLFDLIYNPIQTTFLKKGSKMNTKTINGSEMLKIQAEKSWEIWNK